MKHYYTFGLHIASHFPLSLPPHPAGLPDITILATDTPIPPSEHPWDITGTPHNLRFFWSEAGWFTVESGTTITVSPDSSCGFGVIEDSIVGECLGTTLIQRGELVLHASAVQTADGAVLFCGDSGLGKSTLAYLALQAGGIILADDVCLLKMIEGRPVVVPGPSWLKVRASAIKRANKCPDDYPIAYAESDKYRIESAAGSQPVPVNQIILLERGDDQHLRPCCNMTAFWALMENSFAAHLSESYEFRLLDGAMHKRLFKACEALARIVPVSVFTRTSEIPYPDEWNRLLM